MAIYSLFTIAQDWHRFDYQFKLTDTIEESITYLTPEIIKAHEYKIYVLTSSYSGIRKFYYDETTESIRIVTEVMDEMKDPYLLIAKELSFSMVKTGT